MKRNLCLCGILLILLLLLIIASVLAMDPGSAGDPLVSQSFLQEMYGWKISILPEGETISLGMGTEFILRSGKAKVVGSSGGGLADLTLGKDLPDGTTILANHYILSPVSDGRGVRAVTTVVMLTRGWRR